MGWEQTDLNTVSDAAQPAPPPVGEYIFRLLTAKDSDFVAGRLDFDIVIDDGGYKGRRVFPTLPDPTKQTWALGAAKRLSKALGVDQNSGEGIVEYFNRVASNGHARFQAMLTHDTYTNKSGVEVTKPNINFFSIVPTA